MTTPTSKNILLIDDSATVRTLSRALLNELGFNRIEEADNGRAGLLKINTGNFHLVLCDYNMPEMDGMELLEKLRANAATKALPFVMLTSEAQKENVITAISHGVTHYIVKPPTIEQLSSVLKKIFS